MNKEYIKRINVAAEYISRNLEREMSLEEIAGQANFSKFHFHRIFKACKGETVSAHVRRLRLERAANRLLSESGETITTIALDFGFGSSQSFATSFKRHFGMSPKEFQKQYSVETWEAWKGKVEETEGADSMKGLDSAISPSTSGDAIATNLWINLLDMPSYLVAYERVVGPYNKIQLDGVFERVFTWVYKRCDVESCMALGIVWDNPDVTEHLHCRYDACLTVPAHIEPQGEIGVQSIGGGKHVVGHCEIANYEELEQVYEIIFSRWFPTSNYAPADSVAYEIYLNNPGNHPRGNLLVDICIPVDEI